MTSYVVSLLLGVAVGMIYGLVDVRSPAPPLVALLGLLGMLVGQQAIGLVKRQVAPPAHAATLHTPENLQNPSWQLDERKQRIAGWKKQEGS